jgi:transcriptional regulator with GAF, ATPase, and Fis domain
MPEPLLESQLFGHERGAFTGADRARQGLFEAAHRGTLFLDEAGEMSLALQAKLLRVLVDGQVFRVGSNTARSVDVRIVVATHRDLQQRIRDGQFREDLYYRLAVVPIQLPPLRERRDDIPVFAQYFLQRVIVDSKLPSRRLSVAALKKLQAYHFPGNVRELRNLIERACILAASEEITPDLIPLNVADETVTATGADSGSALEQWLSSLPATDSLQSILTEVERALLVRALESAGGIQAVAARSLSISRSDMNYKLRKHGLQETP